MVLARLVDVSSLSKYFLIYTSLTGKQGHKFIVEEYKVSSSSWEIPINVGIVDAFDCVESPVDRQVDFVWSRLKKVYHMRVDFSTNRVVSGPSLKYQGDIPTLVETASGSRIFYLESRAFKTRETIDDSSIVIVTDPSNFLILHSDTWPKANTLSTRFIGLQTPGYKVALPLIDDANTLILYDYHIANRTLLDQSGNNYDANIGNLKAQDNGVYFSTNEDISVPSWPVPSSLTIEAWISARPYAYRPKILDGDIQFSYNSSGTKLRFQFEGIDTHVYEQTDKILIVNTKEPTYVAVTHTFGDGDSTRLYINGKSVSAKWINGDGDEDPGFTTLSSTINLGLGSSLHQLRVSSSIRSESDILDYINGRI